MLLLYFVVKFESLLEKIFRKLNLSLFYHSRFGIKSFNGTHIDTNYSSSVYYEKVIDPKLLFLGFDFLKDDYTLFHTSIKDSPHYSFVNSLLNNENYLETNYCLRLKKGYLDERRRQFSPIKNKNYFPEIFKNRMKDIYGNSINYVDVFEYNNEYYLIDGKHRAALFALLNKKIGIRVFRIKDIIKNINPKVVAKLKNSKYKKHSIIFLMQVDK